MLAAMQKRWAGDTWSTGETLAPAELTTMHGNALCLWAFPYIAEEGHALAAGSDVYAGKYVGRVDAITEPGHVLVHFDNTDGQQANSAIAGLQLGFAAVTTNGSIQWVCNDRNINGIPLQYLPLTCR